MAESAVKQRVLSRSVGNTKSCWSLDAAFHAQRALSCCTRCICPPIPVTLDSTVTDRDIAVRALMRRR
eukprot:COSAG01_NODE_77_length_28297_cov_104.096230_4_plen_68_part_00